MDGVRERRRVFGEVAADYDAVRAGYAAELVDAVVAFAGFPVGTAIEVGAGTGKATEAFVATGARITCVEPDPAMAAVLSAKFAGDGRVDVVVDRFEDFVPPDGGVDLLYCGQAWHWVDPGIRFDLAAAAVRPGGVVAIFGHRYAIVEEMRAVLDEVYRRVAPSLADPDPGPVAAAVNGAQVPDSPQWTGVTDRVFTRVAAYPTEAYLRLLTTFSGQRMLPPEQLEALLAGVAEAVDAHGGVVEHRLETSLTLARRTG